MHKTRSIPFLCLFLFLNIFKADLNAQAGVIPVWPNGAPGAIADPTFIEETQYDDQGKIRGYSKVSEPDITLFLAEEGLANGSAVLIFPGGGYSHLAIEKEGYKVAKWLNTLGISAFVLKYRMPSDQIMENKAVGPLQDAQEAIRILRKNAGKWKIDPSKIGVMGFSAGGHLAATLSTHYADEVYPTSENNSARPNFSILLYPVVSMKDGITHNGSKRNLLGENPSEEMVEKFSNETQVNSNTPPTFLVHTTVDKAVPVENSIAYYLALKENEVPAEMHLYEAGNHGMGLGISGTNQYWPADCENWLRANGWISAH